MADQLDINRLSAFDTSGDPVSGAQAYFFATGTTTPITVYADDALSVAHPSPLLADSGGVFPAIYYGAATSAKVRVDDASDVTLYTIDPVRRISGDSTGASSITFAPTTSIPVENVQAAIERVEANSAVNFNVISKTADYTVVAADKTKLILCTADLTLALTAAATLGDGFVFNVKAAGGNVTVDPNTSETIDGAATFVVVNGSTATFVCNGANWFSLGSPRLVNSVRAETNALTTISGTAFPLDDTIPQSTEGTELLTLAITPTSASNKLRIRAIIHAGKSTGVDMMMGLFQDSTADALAAIGLEAQTSLSPNAMILDHYMTAGTTSETTFKIRVGSTADIYINGRGGARLFGGTMVSSLTIEEIKA